MCGAVHQSQDYWTGWNQRLFVSSTLLLLLIPYNLSPFAAVLHHFLFTITITQDTALLNSLNACFLPSGGHATLAKLPTLTPFLSNSLMQELTGILILSYTQLANSGTLYLYPSFRLTTT